MLAVVPALFLIVVNGQYNILAGYLGQNMQPWFMYGIDEYDMAPPASRRGRGPRRMTSAIRLYMEALEVENKALEAENKVLKGHVSQEKALSMCTGRVVMEELKAVKTQNKSLKAVNKVWKEYALSLEDPRDIMKEIMKDLGSEPISTLEARINEARASMGSIKHPDLIS